MSEEYASGIIRDIGRLKIRLGRRNARRANPSIDVRTIRARAEGPEALRLMSQCDWIFLAADNHAARHWVNAIVETYLIPATQLGVRVPVDEAGKIGRIHTVYRRMTPGEGCFWCNGLIDPTQLAMDMLPTRERAAARYVDDIPPASVITLNAITSSQVTTDFMFAVTDLGEAAAADHHLEFVRDRTRLITRPRRTSD